MFSVMLYGVCRHGEQKLLDGVTDAVEDIVIC